MTGSVTRSRARNLPKCLAASGEEAPEEPNAVQLPGLTIYANGTTTVAATYPPNIRYIDSFKQKRTEILDHPVRQILFFAKQSPALETSQGIDCNVDRLTMLWVFRKRMRTVTEKPCIQPHTCKL